MEKNYENWMSPPSQLHASNRQVVELEDPRSTPSLKRDSGTRDFRHRCALCRKLRSPAYQREHPVAPGEKPIPGICSRPTCAAKKGAMSALKKKKKKTTPQPQVVVVEVRCYLHNSSSADGPSLPTIAAVELSGREKPSRKELPGGNASMSIWGQRTLRSVEDNDQPPPQVNWASKPTLIYR